DVILESTKLRDLASFNYIHDSLGCSEKEAENATTRALQLYPDLKEVNLFEGTSHLIVVLSQQRLSFQPSPCLCVRELDHNKPACKGIHRNAPYSQRVAVRSDFLQGEVKVLQERLRRECF